MKRILAFALVLGSLALHGCSGDSTAQTDEKQGDPAANASQANVVDFDTSDPKQVVMALIEAMKSGDKEAKAALLTTKAREETAKHELSVVADPMPNTEYQIAEPAYLKNNPDGAHVSCLLTETLADGTPAEYQIVWVLRREGELGWRIAGMAVELSPGTKPQFLNFEDPLDMQNKMAAAAAAAQGESPSEEGGVDQAQATEPVTEATQQR